MRPPNFDSTTRGVLAATFTCAAVVAHLVLAKAARDALFLGAFRVSLLPTVMILGAVVSLVTALVAARIMERRSPVVLLAAALATSAVAYVVEWRLLEAAPRGVAIALYVHVSALGATFVAALWSVVNERFDPHAARRAVGRIAMGGSLGGVLAGIAGWLVSGARGVADLLPMLLGLNVAALAALWVLARASRRIGARHAAIGREPARRTSAVQALRESPYLTKLAALVGLAALSSALLDYVLSARLVARFSDASQLAAFFALFHACIGLLAVLLQLLATRSALERLGLAGTIAILPTTVLLAGIAGIASPQLWSAVVLRGGEGLVQASVFRAAYELSYTPLPRSQKRPTKMLIDVGIDRLGTVAGAGLTLLVVARLGSGADSTLIALAMCVSVGALICASRLHGGYVDALAGRLRRGTLALDERSVLDATTRRTLAETASLDRRQLLRAIERQRSEPPDAAPAATGSETDHGEETMLVGPGVAGFEAAPGYVGLRIGSGASLEGTEEHASDPLVRTLADLRSGDAARIRAALAAPLSPELAAHVVPLLGRDDVALDALHALRSVAAHVTGTLYDVLSDSNRNVVVRRRIPRVLERTATPRAVRTLIDGLFDPELDVRHQSALALLRIAELVESPKLSLPRDRIVDALEAELEEARRHSSQRPPRASDALDVEPRFGQEISSTRLRHDVEHVMTLLALVLEREHVQLAYHALYADESAIRGTAIEYLENVLPERIKAAVLELVTGSTASARPRVAPRDHAAIVDDLQRSREVVMPASLRNLGRQ